MEKNKKTNFTEAQRAEIREIIKDTDFVKSAFQLLNLYKQELKRHQDREAPHVEEVMRYYGDAIGNVQRLEAELAKWRQWFKGCPKVLERHGLFPTLYVWLGYPEPSLAAYENGIEKYVSWLKEAPDA